MPNRENSSGELGKPEQQCRLAERAGLLATSLPPKLHLGAPAACLPWAWGSRLPPHSRPDGRIRYRARNRTPVNQSDQMLYCGILQRGTLGKGSWDRADSRPLITEPGGGALRHRALDMSCSGWFCEAWGPTSDALLTEAVQKAGRGLRLFGIGSPLRGIIRDIAMTDVQPGARRLKLLIGIEQNMF